MSDITEQIPPEPAVQSETVVQPKPTVQSKASKGKENKALNQIFTGQSEAMQQGLKNIASMSAFNSEFTLIPGKEFEAGVLGFRRKKNGLNITVGCGKEPVRFFGLRKLCGLVEAMHDKEKATKILQNCLDQDDYQSGKGQVLARINAKSSAIVIVQGKAGRVLRSAGECVLYNVYYIDRRDLAAFYLAAKSQISTEDELENMIAAYEGWQAYDIPLDPYNTYDD